MRRKFENSLTAVWCCLVRWLLVVRRRHVIERRQLSSKYRNFETFPHWRDVLSILNDILRDQGIPENPNIGDEAVICAHLIPYEFAAATRDYLEWIGWIEVRQFGDVGGFGSYLRYDPLPNSAVSRGRTTNESE